MAFIFIRHLATRYNQQGLLQGQRDEPILPLTNNDQTLQTTLNANKVRLNNLPINQVLCSTLKRTQQTAAVYNYHETLVEPLLNELNFGFYEGKSRQQLLHDYGESWQNDPRDLVFGESMQDFLLRIQAYFEKYQHNLQYENILAFTHGAWMRAARAWWVTGSLQTMNQIKVANNELLVLD